jgi:hypothetical protein
MVMSGYGRRTATRNIQTTAATSAKLIAENRMATCHRRCPATRFASTTAASKEANALPTRRRGARIMSAMAMAFEGQNNAMPPGMRVNQMAAQPDAKNRDPITISGVGTRSARDRDTTR